MSRECDKIKPGSLVRYRNPHWDSGTAVVLERLPDTYLTEAGGLEDMIKVQWLDSNLLPSCRTAEFTWDVELISE
jgi:hypothetical protein